MIDGVDIKRLNWFKNEKGRLIEILRSDDDIFDKFGQAYLSTINPGVIKGWHLHYNQADNICCVQGSVKLVLKDNREGSRTYGAIEDFILSGVNSSLIRIPPGVYHGLQCLGSREAYIFNLTDSLYQKEDPDEEIVDLDDIEYSWEALKI
ncbi:MAG: dTDP-4-dehydrorhamnose 3,5-epimerase family protein [Candidatus Kaelpia aquatica]|nr:dTDP-4-dehydrorhamnose 3,5-epimerase family protein [Candidatus Kaelpia aquatica]